MSERDDPFLDLGYTSPDEAVELRDARLGKQKIDQVTARQQRVRKPHRRGPGPDLESDRDHQLASERAEFEVLTDEQLEERRATARKGRLAIEAALDEAFGKDRHIKEIEEKAERLSPIDPDNYEASKKAQDRLKTALLTQYFEDHPHAS